MKLLLTYAAAIVNALALLALLKVACLMDAEIRQANAAGERLDHIDDAFDRLDAIHQSIFGS